MLTSLQPSLESIEIFNGEFTWRIEYPSMSTIWTSLALRSKEAFWYLILLQLFFLLEVLIWRVAASSFSLSEGFLPWFSERSLDACGSAEFDDAFV